MSNTEKLIKQLNENKETLLSFGMNEVITKPFEPDFFYEVIHSYLATNELSGF